MVEADGIQTHGTHVAFQRDRWRDQLLAANGYGVVRVTWKQLETERTATMRRIRRMLGKSRESTSKGG